MRFAISAFSASIGARNKSRHASHDRSGRAGGSDGGEGGAGGDGGEGGGDGGEGGGDGGGDSDGDRGADASGDGDGDASVTATELSGDGDGVASGDGDGMAMAIEPLVNKAMSSVRRDIETLREMRPWICPPTVCTPKKKRIKLSSSRFGSCAAACIPAGSRGFVLGYRVVTEDFVRCVV